MNFIFSNLNTIILAVWLAFFFVVIARAFKPSWVGNISYRWLVVIAIGIHLLYGAVATFGQYRAWATANDVTRALFSAPLSAEVPLPAYIEWSRFLFEYPHGYFVFYSFGHFFLSTIALLIIVGLFLLFLVVRSRTHPINFREGDISMIILAMLISGWPGVIVLLPIGLVTAVLLSIIARVVYGVERTPLPPAFLIAAPFALLLAPQILATIHLYNLLKL